MTENASQGSDGSRWLFTRDLGTSTPPRTSPEHCE
ncbi:hypothetical protein QJS66_01185 [Kocuria rhizophila]|nr:hypothetical protein QJS66_01185 [Kocuria rhizophila]